MDGDFKTDHSVPGRLIRTRLMESLDFENVRDGAHLDRANDQGHPDNQAIYVEFAGEHASDRQGLDHVWHVWLIQRRDYPDWEKEYGNLRACLIQVLLGWQPATNLEDLKLLRNRCFVEDGAGLRADLTAWRVTELKF